MSKFLTTISVALLLFGGSATAALPRTRTQQTVNSIASREPMRSSALGVFAVNLKGDTLAVCNIRQKMVPASNVKLITTGLALKDLGPDFRFETTLAYNGQIKDSTLVGDLYIVGGGDPTTGSVTESAEKTAVTFGKWEKILREAGINRIEGRIVADPRYFDDQTAENLSWSYDDIGTYYGTGPTGLNFFENIQTFYVTPGAAVGAKPYVRPRYPETPWMEISVSATTSKARSSNDLYYVVSDMVPVGEVRGKFPVDRRGYTLECSNKFGAYTCAAYFYKYLVSKKLTVTNGYADIDRAGRIRSFGATQGIPVSAAARKDLVKIGSAFSPKLVDIVGDTNRDSDNFYAEALLRMLGKKNCGSAIYDSCRVVVENLLQDMGLSTVNACQIYDGSGLGRKNYISPEFFVSFLRKMARSKVFEPYFASLPQPGSKGTLEMILRESPDSFKSRIHAKTGSMNGVRCVSGYIEASDGNPENMIVFSLLMNNFTVSNSVMTHIVEDILASLALEN